MNDRLLYTATLLHLNVTEAQNVIWQVSVSKWHVDVLLWELFGHLIKVELQNV